MSNRIPQFISSLLASAELEPQITCHKIIQGRKAEHGEVARPLPKAVQNLLIQKGISLYSHQAKALNHIRSGMPIVAATPTASGKSLIYNLPILERFLQDRESTALYISPLKALAQDQLASFRELIAPWPESARPTATLYDGDTPLAERKAIRTKPPQLLLTNPEMLHFGILPYHEKWTTFFAGLSWIIVDEAHIYRGIFGSHMAQIFRRLNRIAQRYGSRPQYIFCTATLGNPSELAGALMGSNPPAPVLESGAPAGKRHFIFINPLFSPATCAIDLLRKALALNLRTIVYCQSRRMTELISIWLQEADDIPQNTVSAYRAGFLPEERRQIEKKMASGELKAVISTSALELGIDIGGLDLCILVGYPGTIMQTFQRGGRVGRASQESAVALIAGEDALDQYFIRHPEELFSRPSEKAVINPDNESILKAHLQCAAAEFPIHPTDSLLNNPAVSKALGELEAAGHLARSINGEWIALDQYPHKNVDMRSGGATFTIENGEGEPIGTIDAFRAWKETHPGAVYLHNGQSYLIESLDSGAKRLKAIKARLNWFTRIRGHKNTDILKLEESVALGNCVLCRGRLRVSEFLTGYEKRSSKNQELLGIVPLDAPPRIFETDGLWIVVPDEIRKILEKEFLHFMGAIHAVEHAAIGLLPLEIMADRNDFGGISQPLHPQLGMAAVFIYDAVPGGAGLSKAAFSDMRKVLAATLDAIRNCGCEDGCPSCIHSPKCGAGNRPLSKEGAIRLLELLLENGEMGVETERRLSISPAPELFSPPDNSIAPASPPVKATNTSPQKIESPEAKNARAESFFDRLAKTGGIGHSGKPTLAPQRPSQLPRFVVFDVETRKSAAEVGGWANAARMGVSVAVLYEQATDKFYAYSQDELDLFFLKLTQAELVVGFNSYRFDYEVLSPFAEISRSAPGLSLRSLPGLDLLQKVVESSGVRVSLNNLCQATLNAEKSANGIAALRWWQKGEIDKIRHYCERDVRLTRDLYLTGLEKGEVCYTNKSQKLVRIKVDFSTPSKNGQRRRKRL